MTKKILIADDDKATRRLMQIIINRLGFDVEMAADGKEALDMVSNKDFDLVLMDLDMPKMDGYEATNAIRSIGKDTKIYALTGNKMCSLSDLQEKADLNGLIYKTADRDAFKELFQKIFSE